LQTPRLSRVQSPLPILAPLTEAHMYFGIYLTPRMQNEFEAIGQHISDDTPALFASLLTWLRGLLY
jgi:hypothetical protein